MFLKFQLRSTTLLGPDPKPDQASDAPQHSNAEALARISVYTDNEPKVEIETFPGTEEMKYCPECYVPLYPDPKPEKLYIFLHALRYTTSLGCFETEMPAWAAKEWKWDRD